MPETLAVTPAALADLGSPLSLRVAQLSRRLAALLRMLLPPGARDERVAFLETQSALGNAGGVSDAMIRLADAFELSGDDVDLLILAALPDEHEGFCHVLRSLHPRSEPRPTLALAAQLFGEAG